MSNTYEITQACLLRDFGEILCRAEIGAGAPEQRTAAYFSQRLSREVLEAIAQSVDGACAGNPSARLVQIAHAIARGAGARASVSPTDTLESIFNRLNGQRGCSTLAADWPEGGAQYASEGLRNSPETWRNVLSRWEASAEDALFAPSHADALLALMERCFSYVPASSDGRMDVSLYHQGKAAAAIGGCIARWLDAGETADCARALAGDSRPFMLVTLDLSGIQTFIYTISNKGALKGLRARSFYLSMLMEHIADMALDACGLCRANLIYSGGGRAQLLLPNTRACLASVESTVAQVNDFLLDKFGASLYLAWGHAEATAAELSSTGEGRTFPDIFREASRHVSARKLHRYGADALRAINRRDGSPADERECVVCGRSGRLRPHGDDGDMICEICLALERFSSTLTEDDLTLAVLRDPRPDSLPLPGGFWLARADGSADARTYRVNSPFAPLPRAVWLDIGNAHAENDDGTAMTFEQLSGASLGVKRLGVFRADVDNLGALFASGFREAQGPAPHRHETLPRYMALSAALTAFFQREINAIVAPGGDSWLPDAEPQKRRRVSIVYSGGDDVFLVGAWNEALDAGLALQRAFQRYTGGHVTLSGGLGLFTDHEPVGVMAGITAELEEDAKLMPDGAKNALALFAPVDERRNGTSFAFHWDDLKARVLDDKLPLLSRAFSGGGDADAGEAGNAFLYQALLLLRDIRRDPIAIAHLAYLLARHAPDPKRATEDRVQGYDTFMKRVYAWALEPEQNRALQAAILLHVYAHRGERESDVQ